MATLSLAIYFGRRAGVAAVKTTWAESFAEGRGMMRMGVMLSLSGLFGLMTGYFTNVFIGRTGSLADVGLYSAGFALVNTYVGMIFSAMGTDYYPRLSAVAVDKVRANQLANQQMEMALLILGPILVLFLILVEVAIRVLYSSEFLGVAPMVQWSVLAIFLKAAVWSMGYLLLAHNDARVFLFNELTASAYTFILNIGAYILFGVEGLGISFLVAYVLSLVQTFLVVRMRYGFRFAGRASGILGIQLLLGGTAFALVRLPDDFLVLGLQAATFLFASAYSIIHLNSRIDLVSLAKGVWRKN
jgi:O-antigen/teichoic acid export membrane protein